IFINKMDREGKDAFDLLEEIETKLNISLCPLSWPIGQGHTFKGVYSIYNKRLNLFEADKTKISDPVIQVSDLDDPKLPGFLKEQELKTLKDDLELVEGVYGQLDDSLYKDGLLAPVFFGSAINNFGIKE